MRDAVAEAFKRVTGQEPEHCFSGWGDKWSEQQLAVIEHRLPAEAQAEIVELRAERDRLRAENQRLKNDIAMIENEAAGLHESLAATAAKVATLAAALRLRKRGE